jgi:hypothetical protein
MQKPMNQYPFLNFNISITPPIKTNTVRNFDPAIIEQDAQSTRIIAHHRFPDLVREFLEHKKKHGSTHEKSLYSEDFTWEDQVARLLEKRAMVFMGRDDYTVLRDGRRIVDNPTLEWDRNGTETQHLNEFLSLKEYLSYDEIMLGSLLGVSSPSFFINDGNRYNCGKPGATGTFESRGVIMGLVGARFERLDRMDSVHILKTTEQQPKQHPEATKIFQDFFGVAQRNPNVDFDVEMYRARIRVTAEVLLLEANARAGEVGQKAYVYVVGLGLGVWQYHGHPTQAEDYIEAFVEALRSLRLPHVATVEFAWIRCSEDR